MSVSTFGDPEKVIARRLDAMTLAQPMVTRCASCTWEHAGTFEAGREAHRQHRRLEHPELRVHVRNSRVRGGSLTRIRGGDLAPDERAELEADRQRRAKLAGIEEELAPWAP